MIFFTLEVMIMIMMNANLSPLSSLIFVTGAMYATAKIRLQGYWYSRLVYSIICGAVDSISVFTESNCFGGIFVILSHVFSGSSGWVGMFCRPSFLLFPSEIMRRLEIKVSDKSVTLQAIGHYYPQLRRANCVEEDSIFWEGSVKTSVSLKLLIF